MFVTPFQWVILSQKPRTLNILKTSPSALFVFTIRSVFLTVWVCVCLFLSGSFCPSVCVCHWLEDVFCLWLCVCVSNLHFFLCISSVLFHSSPLSLSVCLSRSVYISVARFLLLTLSQHLWLSLCSSLFFCLHFSASLFPFLTRREGRENASLFISLDASSLGWWHESQMLIICRNSLFWSFVRRSFSIDRHFPSPPPPSSPPSMPSLPGRTWLVRCRQVWKDWHCVCRGACCLSDWETNHCHCQWSLSSSSSSLLSL